MPVTLMFNAGEQPGRLEISHDDTLKTPLGAPMTAVVKAAKFNLCGVAPKGTGAKPAATAPVAPAPAPRSVIARTPAEGFATTLTALMLASTDPQNSFYDWRHIESLPNVRWQPLPPDMLDKPLEERFYFRRNGTVTVGDQPIKAMAAGARTMVMAHYFKNESMPIGEEALLAALRRAGLTITTARCPIMRNLPAPRWYRLSGGGKRPAYLWIAAARGSGQPWEGFSLVLEDQLKPLTPRERAVYTDKCA